MSTFFAPEMSGLENYTGRMMKPLQHNNDAGLNAINNVEAPGVDAALIERFVIRRDSEAFSELVRRHGNTVSGVCRRVLKNPHDVDDVFQATFLTLARDVSRVQKRESLAIWLYGVAYRLSLRVAKQKERRRETSLVETAVQRDPVEELSGRGDLQLVDEELNSLPDRYRKPLVLRYLSGLPPRDVANELGISIGTLDGLLRRGKDALKNRLVRRGLTAGTAVAAIDLMSQTSNACDVSLIEATIRLGVAFQSGNHELMESVSDQVLELMDKELDTMSVMTKAGWLAGVIAGSLLLGAIGLNVLGECHNGQVVAGVVSSLKERSTAVSSIGQAALVADANVEAKKLEPAVPVETNTLKKPQASPEVREVKKGGPAIPADAQAIRAWDYKPRSPATIKIEKALRSEVALDLVAVPLRDLFDMIKDEHHLVVHVDYAMLEQETGINDQTPINLKVDGISLKSALRIILSRIDCDYIIDNEILKVTSSSQANEFIETRVYNVSRLKHLDPVELLEIITSTVKPDSWAKSGGIGDLRAAPNSLIVMQNQRVHDEIVNLFDQLEAQSLESPPGEVVPANPVKSRVVGPTEQHAPGGYGFGGP